MIRVPVRASLAPTNPNKKKISPLKKRELEKAFPRTPEILKNAPPALHSTFLAVYFGMVTWPMPTRCT